MAVLAVNFISVYVSTTMNVIDTLRHIIEQHNAQEIDKLLVDVQSANAVVSVHDKLNPQNQHKFTQLNIRTMVDVAWKLIGRSS
jgi:hypothetical protein